MIDSTTPAHFLEMMEEFDGRHDVVDAIDPAPFMRKPVKIRSVVIEWHSPRSVSCGGGDEVGEYEPDVTIIDNRNLKHA